MLASKNEYINSAYKQLQIISQDKQKQIEYDAKMKATLDYNQDMLEARQEGLEIGIKNLIVSLRNFNIEDKAIVSQIVKLYQISYEEAQQYLKKY